LFLAAAMGTCLDLYCRLLGEAWQRLDERIRCFHSGNSPVHGRGVFRVEQGSSRLARALARLVGMPRPGGRVELTLDVSAESSGEQWRRSFAGRPLVTLQSQRQDGLLVERVGIMEMRFRLDVVNGALCYQSTGAAFRLMGIRLPVPSWLSPRIRALESAAPQADQIQVSVEVQLPLVGRLIAYEGSITRVGAQP
jgi:hypothetical protein